MSQECDVCGRDACGADRHGAESECRRIGYLRETVKTLRMRIQGARNVLLNHARQNPTDRTCAHGAELCAEAIAILEEKP